MWSRTQEPTQFEDAGGARCFGWREPCRAWLLAAIPFALLAALSVAGSLTSWMRFAAWFVLAGMASGLAWLGWPRHRQAVVSRAGQLSTTGGRVLLNHAARLVFSAARTPTAESSDYRFQILAEDDAGSCHVLFTHGDPGVVATRTKELSEWLGLPVDEERLARFGAPLFDAPNPHATSVNVSELFARLPRFPRHATWIAWGGCLFVWAVTASLLRAHLLRGGSVGLASWVLVALLCGIGLLLPKWAKGTRIWIGSEEGPSTLRTSTSSSGATLYTQGLIGARVLTRWGRATLSTSVVTPGVAGHWFLLVTTDKAVTAQRLPIPTCQGVPLAQR